MSDKQGWKERLRGDVRLTLPEKPDIVGRYTSCERFLPEDQKPVRAWIAAGAACAAVLIALAAFTIPYVAGSLPKEPGIGPGEAESSTGMEDSRIRAAFAAYWAENGGEPWSADAFGLLGTCGDYAVVTYAGPGDDAVHSILLDGYTFLSPAIYSPSPLGMYIVWSDRVSTLEDAAADGSVQAADVWRMLPKERRGAGGSSAALPTTATSAVQTPFFYATILESLNGSYMVRPEADFKYAGERVHVSAPKGAPVFEAGDRITVYYDGRIMETYPPQVNALRIEACTVQTTNPGPQVKTTGKPPASVTNPSTPGARGEMAGRLFDHLEKIGAWPKGMYERAAFTETVPVLYDGISYTVFRQHMGAHWDAQLDGKPYSEDIGGYTFTGGQMAPYSLAIYVVTRDEVLTLQEAYEQGKVDIAALHAAMYPDEKN